MGIGRRPYRSFFWKLSVSYSLVSLLPLLLVWLVLLVSGTRLVISVAEGRAEQFIASIGTSMEKQLNTYLAIGESLAESEVIQESLNTRPEAWSSKRQLDFYQTLFQALQGHLYSVEVHLSTEDGSIQLSSHEFPGRYDFTNYPNTEGIFRDFKNLGKATALYVDPHSNAQGSRLALSAWYQLPKGYLIMDILAFPIIDQIQSRFFDTLILADHKTYNLFSIYRSEQSIDFTEYPELGIMFSSDFQRVLNNRILVQRFDLYPDISLVAITDLDNYFLTLREVLASGLVIILFAAILTLLVSLGVSKNLSTPIHSLVTAMGGHLMIPQTLEPNRRDDEIGYLIRHYNAMVEEMMGLLNLVRQEEQALRLAERKALQARINPHFLNNTLGTIKSMARLGDTQAVVSIVNDLGKILRFTMTDTEGMISLERCVDLINRYLHIQKLRFEDRMITKIHVEDGCHNTMVPKLLIQPIVENAVIHGVERMSRPVRISLDCSVERGMLLVVVEDDGPGMKLPSNGSDCIGMENVRQRLELLYQGTASMQVISPFPEGAAGGTRVEIRLPGQRAW